MEERILKAIDDLEKGFEKKGFHRLKAEITKKRKNYSKRSGDINNESQRLLLLKKTFTNILVMIDKHVNMGEKHALSHLGMLENIEDFFEETMGYSNNQIVVENNGTRYSLEEIRPEYEGFKQIRGSLIQLIKKAKNKGYLTDDKEINKIIREDGHERRY